MPVTVVTRRYGVARQMVHQWLRRYANEGGLGALADRSPKPDSCPHQMSVVTEARVVAVRREHPGGVPTRGAGSMRVGGPSAERAFHRSGWSIALRSLRSSAIGLISSRP
jgi:hypothetical protein